MYNDKDDTLREQRQRIEDLEKRLSLLCERAVVDFDDEAVGIANVAPPGTYGDWLRAVLTAWEESRAPLPEGMREFPHPNFHGGFQCLICKTSADRPVTLVGIPGTERGDIQEAAQVHAECFRLFERMHKCARAATTS